MTLISLDTLSHFPEGDTHGVITGPAGRLEILTHEGEDKEDKKVVVICHPNPVQGGTMHNKVVYTLAKAFLAKGIKVVRFNYRGVGQSEGEFGHAIGEVADLNAVIIWVKKVLGETAPLYLAGFSFGTYVSACWAITHHWPIEQLFSVAPGVDRHNFDKLIAEQGLVLTHQHSWVVVQGEEDEVVSPQAVYNWIDNLPKKLAPYLSFVRFPETGHFFHGKLLPLRETIMKYILTK